jgi:hypothetical protein
MSTTLTVETNGLFQAGDIIKLDSDIYLGHIVLFASANVLEVRKVKWYEDRDTAFLVSFVYCGLTSILFLLIGI